MVVDAKADEKLGFVPKEIIEKPKINKKLQELQNKIDKDKSQFLTMLSTKPNFLKYQRRLS